MAYYVPKVGENIADVVVKLYGSLDYYLKLLEDNNLSFEQSVAGVSLYYDETIKKSEAKTLRKVRTLPTTYTHSVTNYQSNYDLSFMFAQGFDNYLAYLQGIGREDMAALLPISTEISGTLSKELIPTTVRGRGLNFATSERGTDTPPECPAYSLGYNLGYCSPELDFNPIQDILNIMLVCYSSKQVVKNVQKYVTNTNSDIIELKNQVESISGIGSMVPRSSAVLSLSNGNFNFLGNPSQLFVCPDVSFTDLDESLDGFYFHIEQKISTAAARTHGGGIALDNVEYYYAKPSNSIYYAKFPGGDIDEIETNLSNYNYYEMQGAAGGSSIEVSKNGVLEYTDAAASYAKLNLCFVGNTGLSEDLEFNNFIVTSQPLTSSQRTRLRNYLNSL